MCRKKPIKVWIDGCYDLTHFGHYNAFRQARALGDHLIVGLNPDSEVQLVARAIYCTGTVCAQRECVHAYANSLERPAKCALAHPRTRFVRWLVVPLTLFFTISCRS